MWIIFGSSNRQKALGQHFRWCTRCTRETVHVVRQEQQWFTLFFIPVLPVTGKKEIDHCNVCGLETPHVESSMVIEGQVENVQVLCCPTCAAEVSSDDSSCPSCGQPLAPLEDQAASQSVQSRQQLMQAQMLQQIQQNKLRDRIRRFRIWGVILAVLGGALLLFQACFLISGGWRSSDDPTSLVVVSLLCFLVPALALAGGGGFLLWKAVQLGKPSP